MKQTLLKLSRVRAYRSLFHFIYTCINIHTHTHTHVYTTTFINIIKLSALRAQSLSHRRRSLHSLPAVEFALKLPCRASSPPPSRPFPPPVRQRNVQPSFSQTCANLPRHSFLGVAWLATEIYPSLRIDPLFSPKPVYRAPRLFGIDLGFDLNFINILIFFRNRGFGCAEQMREYDVNVYPISFRQSTARS